MSAPIKQDENSKQNSQDALLYAPPWARAQAARREPQFTSAPPAAAKPGAKLGDSKINWPPAPSKLARFEGDVGMTELRRRLTLEPDLVPEPPLRMQRRPVARLSLASCRFTLGWQPSSLMPSSSLIFCLAISRMLRLRATVWSRHRG